MSRKSVSGSGFSVFIRRFAVLVITSISVCGQFSGPAVTVGGIGPLDEQTGYFPQPLRVTNPGTTAYPGLRVLIGNLPLDTATNVVRVANAHGTTNKIPFFEYGP